jgi:hypothetical protein
MAPFLSERQAQVEEVGEGSDQSMPGAESGPDAGLQRGAIALVLGMVHGLDMPGVGERQFLSRAERVVPGAAIIHDDDRERAGQPQESIDDPG